MANVNAPFGLRPVRYRNGAAYTGGHNLYYVPSTYGTALYIGDAVVRTGTGNAAAMSAPGYGSFDIGVLPEVNKATAGDVPSPGTQITGVIVGFAPSPTALDKIYNPASTARVIMVADDPELVFEIQADGAVPAASIGLNAVLINTQSGNTSTGLSGTELDTSSDVPAADASNQLLILRASPRVDNDTTLTRARVEVLINQHTEMQGSAGALGI